VQMPAGQSAHNTKKYRPSLTALMRHKHPDRFIDNDTIFSVEELGAVTPLDVYSFFCDKAYGKPDPDGDDRPTLCRSSTIEFHKKAISNFMPNRLPEWNVLTSHGNPTKSILVNDLIKAIKKHEVRKEGVESKAVRPLELSEFDQLVAMVRNLHDRRLRYSLNAFFQFQFAMIARGDDASKLLLENLKANPSFDFSLLCSVNWSKNVMEERAVSDQILLGAMDHRYCILLGLAVHLEKSLTDGMGMESSRLFEFANTAKLVKNKAQSAFKEVVDNPVFARKATGALGTHSVRKAPATFARRNGCSRDDVDHRGRWKGDKRVVDRYIHCDLPYPDAKVAAALCIGGACKYLYRDGSGVTDGWLLHYVVPQINARCGEQVALVLGKALMWSAFSDDPALRAFLPPELVFFIREGYERIPNRTIEDLNPIEKRRVNISGYEGTVYIREIEEVQVANATADGASVNERTELIGLYSTIATLQSTVLELKTEIEQTRIANSRSFETLGRHIRRIALQPIARRRATNNNINNEPMVNNNEPMDEGAARIQRMDNDEDPMQIPEPPRPQVAILSKTPRTLDELWIEFQFGIAGRKAAKNFTREERGKCRQNYYRRNVLWRQVGLMIRAGESAQTAIDKIRAVYGEGTSVTKTLNLMLADRKNGGNPQLRV
jgi:hypothetical protein